MTKTKPASSTDDAGAAVFGCIVAVKRGDDPQIADAVTAALGPVDGAHVLARDDGTGPALITVVGGEAAVLAAAAALASRVEALASVTVAPVRGATPDDAADLARRCVSRIGDGPDVTLRLLVARAMPVEFRVNLVSADEDLARRIAATIGEEHGGFPAVSARARRADDGTVQVACTLADYETTGFRTLYIAAEILAKEAATDIRDSEIVGLVPAAALDDELAEEVRLAGFDPARQIIERVAERD